MGVPLRQQLTVGSYLIKQKILIQTELLQAKSPTKEDKTFVLFLPENEIHELGLMYLNYEVQRSGYKTIFLGDASSKI